jgi:hypothetical protein
MRNKDNNTEFVFSELRRRISELQCNLGVDDGNIQALVLIAELLTNALEQHEHRFYESGTQTVGLKVGP